MKQSAIATLLCLLPTIAMADWPVVGPNATPTPQVVTPEQHFQPADLSWDRPIGTAAHDLAAVADSTAAHLYRHDIAHDMAPHGMLDAIGVSRQDLRDTLAFIVRIAAEDAHRPGQRLEDPEFLAEHFTAYRWRSDVHMASGNGVRLQPEQVRITKYLVYQHLGRTRRDATYNTPLMAVPHDEDGLTVDEADAVGTLNRHTFTRKQVLDGAYLTGGAAEGQAEVLAWMRRQDVHEALMQGTVELTFPTGTTRTFNVHRSNGIPYEHGVRDPEQQDRFWYFRQVDGVRGWGEDPEDKVLLRPGAAVAGDVQNLGLGALFAIQGTNSLRLTVLADTGGAFEPNLYQLDFFAGAYPDRATFDRAVADIPARAPVWLLVLK